MQSWVYPATPNPPCPSLHSVLKQLSESTQHRVVESALHVHIADVSTVTWETERERERHLDQHNCIKRLESLVWYIFVAYKNPDYPSIHFNT